MLKKTAFLAPLKTATQILFFSALFILMPIYLALGKGLLMALALYFLANILSVIFLLMISSRKKCTLEYRVQGLQEKINVLKDENSREFKNHAALKAKIARYGELKNIIEELNRDLDLGFVAQTLTGIAFSNIANQKGVCILYLIDKSLDLKIFKTRKENKAQTIRAKGGDIFDQWVLRHISPLLVDNARNDFRFDAEKLKRQESRPIASLISSPIISEHRFLGTLRLDHARPNFFTQDDLRFLATISDLGAVAMENSELFNRTRELAIHDALTGLFTKGYFLERLRDECLRSLRRNAVFSLLMMDIDLFKNYNDRFGHAAGDMVLKSISGIVSESFKEKDFVISRFGGEEFCVFFPGVNKKEAFQLAELLRQRIEQEKIVLRRQVTRITISIGLAAFPADASEEEELIRQADKAMYQAKQKGRNQTCCL